MAEHTGDQEGQATEAAHSGNGAMLAGAVNWRRDVISEFESLWSIAHKFAHLNRVGATVLKRVFGSVSGDKKPGHAAFWGKDDPDRLLELGCLDAKLLMERLGLSRRQIDLATTAAYELPAFESSDETVTFSRLSLRYCPKCIKKGFHSPLYQHSWIARCPIHDVPLADTCPGCRQFIPYELAPQALANPYGCKCGRVLWSARDTMRWTRPLSANEGGVLAAYLSWCAEIRHHPALAFREFGFSANSRASSWDGQTRYVDLWSAAGRWNEIHPLIGWHANTFFRAKHEVHSYVGGGQRYTRIHCRPPATEKADFGITQRDLDALMTDFRIVYKCIRRRLLRTVLHNHRRCISRLSPLVLLEGFWLTPPFCPWARAFMVWRTRWIGHDGRNAEILHRPPKISSVNSAIMIKIEDCLHEAAAIVGVDGKGKRARQERMAMIRWICARVLGFSMLASFDDAVRYSIEKLGARGGYDLSQHNTHHPYFLFRFDMDTGEYGIHWWMIPVLERLEEQARAVTWHTRKMERHIRSLTAKYYGRRMPRVRRRIEERR